MTNQEAINYLKQIYPQGGCRHLDEQRMTAIGMAIDAIAEKEKNGLKRPETGPNRAIRSKLNNYISKP